MKDEEIWRKIKSMTKKDLKQLAYEIKLRGLNVEFINHNCSEEAKSIQRIEFFKPHDQYSINENNSKYFKVLKEILDNDNIIHIFLKRYNWLPRFVNDWREGEVVKSYIGKRFKEDWPNRWYRILSGKTIAGKRPRSLFLWLYEDKEVVYKMTECKNTNGVEEMTFEKTNKY